MALVAVDPGAVAAAESVKARIQAKYLVAINKPRNPDQARQTILKECKRPGFAESVEFKKPVGGKKIKGLSIRFTEVALAAWENADVDTTIVYEDENYRRVKVTVMDLENNTTFSKEVQVRKTVERKNPRGREILSERTNTKGEIVYIVKATDDELQNKENAMVSKAIRNEGLRLLPADIKDEAVQVARQTVRDRDAKDPDAAKKKILDSFASIGISANDIEKYLKHKTDRLTPKELEDLRDIYVAINEGEATWAQFFGTKDEEGNDDTPPGGPKAGKTKKPSGKGETEQTPLEKEFWHMVKESEVDEGLIKRFVDETATEWNREVSTVMTSALKQWDAFLKRYEAWKAKQKTTKTTGADKDKESSRAHEVFEEYIGMPWKTFNGKKAKGVNEVITEHASKLKGWNDTADGMLVVELIKEKCKKLKESKQYLAFLDELLNPKPKPDDVKPDKCDKAQELAVANNLWEPGGPAQREF
jgi:hypothetical protein